MICWKTMRNLTEPKSTMTISPHERLQVELLESYQRRRRLHAWALCPSLPGSLQSFISATLRRSLSFFPLQTCLL